MFAIKVTPTFVWICRYLELKIGFFKGREPGPEGFEVEVGGPVPLTLPVIRVIMFHTERFAERLLDGSVCVCKCTMYLCTILHSRVHFLKQILSDSK